MRILRLEVFHLSSSQDSYFYFKIAVVFSSTLLPHLHIYAMPNHNAKFSTQPVHKYVMFQVDNDESPFGFRYLLPSKYLTDSCRRIQALHISVCIVYCMLVSHIHVTKRAYTPYCLATHFCKNLSSMIFERMT